MTKDLTKWLAFTLAEVLITLAIIGVVAGLTIPSLLANTNEKGLNTADSVFQRRLGEALKIMNLQGTLAGQPSTEAFVKELGRHMKITKTCDENHLSECFVSEFTSGTETIDVSKLKASKNLSSTDYGTKTVGVVFGNGTRALIAYNPKATQDQFNNSNEAGSPVRLTTSGSGKQTLVSLDSDALSILYILQERKNNNVYDNSAMPDNKGNIRGKNISFSTSPECPGTKVSHNGKTYCYLAKTYEAVDCRSSNSSNPDYEYCKPTPSGEQDDYWAGAKKACADLGGLPDKDTLSGYFEDGTLQTALGLTSSDFFWSASEFSTYYAWNVHSSDGGLFYMDDDKDIQKRVLCASN